MCLRPATPGFVVTLAATICLVVVSFSVPWFKTVYFLKAGLAVENISGNVTFGTLGYCLQLPSNTTCSAAKIGYQFDPNELNQLLGLNGTIQLPQLFVQWLTYPLVLHLVALILAAISAVFGLLAHVREMSMTCFSTCISGFAATITLIAFIFDLVIFFVARARLNSVSGGSASIGSAVWLTLAAWILLFIAGCAFGFGRCCLSRRPRMFGQSMKPQVDSSYGDSMRLDAVKAEADRKARQKTEVGLPAFQEYEAKPLTAKLEPKAEYLEEEEDEVPTVPYRDQSPARPSRQNSQPMAYNSSPVKGLTPPYLAPTYPPAPSMPAPAMPYPAQPQRGQATSPPPQGQLSDPYGSYGAHVPEASYYSAHGQHEYQPTQYSNNGGGYGDYHQSNYAEPQPQSGYPPEGYHGSGAYEPSHGGYGATQQSSHSQYESYESQGAYGHSNTYDNMGQSGNDYVDPFSRPMDNARPDYRPYEAQPQVEAGLSSVGQAQPTEYQSHFLSQPDMGYNRSPPPIQTAQEYIHERSPTSPTRGVGGPRGPRPPSSGGWREPDGGSAAPYANNYGGYQR